MLAAPISQINHPPKATPSSFSPFRRVSGGAEINTAAVKTMMQLTLDPKRPVVFLVHAWGLSRAIVACTVVALGRMAFPTTNTYLILAEWRAPAQGLPQE